jgi:hypothetical protein
LSKGLLRFQAEDPILFFCGHPKLVDFLTTFKPVLGGLEQHYIYYTKLLMLAYNSADICFAVKITQVSF